MSQTKTNIIYTCKKCGAKGTLANGVITYNFKQLKTLPCGCSADNGKFFFLHPQ